MTELSRLLYLLRKKVVWYRLKATPIFRSSSCRASTAWASFWFGSDRLAIAWRMSGVVMAE